MAFSPRIDVLTHECATEHSASLTNLVSRIPNVTYTPDQVLSTKKSSYELQHKWDLSLAAFDKDYICGVLMAGVRQQVEEQLYREPSIYISELAVDALYEGQGVGRMLMHTFLKRIARTMFYTERRILPFSLQTNADPSNRKVQTFYESFGFQKVGEKQYANRLDYVYRLEYMQMLEQELLHFGKALEALEIQGYVYGSYAVAHHGNDVQMLHADIDITFHDASDLQAVLYLCDLQGWKDISHMSWQGIRTTEHTSTHILQSPHGSIMELSYLRPDIDIDFSSATEHPHIPSSLAVLHPKDIHHIYEVYDFQDRSEGKRAVLSTLLDPQ